MLRVASTPYHGLRLVAPLAGARAGCGRADTGAIIGRACEDTTRPSRSPSSSRTVLRQLAAPDVYAHPPQLGHPHDESTTTMRRCASYTPLMRRDTRSGMGDRTQ
jgi:hypothetical protein